MLRMLVERIAGPDEFVAAAWGFLIRREAQHNLMLGLCGRLRAEPRLYGLDPYFAVARDGGRVVAAALRTPPHNLLLSEFDIESAGGALALDAHEIFTELPGVLGPVDGSARFAERWQALTGARGRIAVSERIYRAEAVPAPPPVDGRMRPYQPADRKLVLGWLDGFVTEVMHGPLHLETVEQLLERRLAEPAGGLVLWETDRGVSLAGFGGETPNGIRIGPVYTPPELRGRGYASALVAGLTERLLAAGRRLCFLFTDLANPTSNSIYQRVGYRPVADVSQWAFD